MKHRTGKKTLAYLNRTDIQRQKKSTKFTLIELLIVISIIAILMTMLLPALKKARDMSKEIACVGNLKQIGIGTSMYINDHDSYFPLYHYQGSGFRYYYSDLINPYLNIARDVPLLEASSTSTYPNWARGTWKNPVYYCPSRQTLDDWSNVNSACYGVYGPNPNLMAFWDLNSWYNGMTPKRISDNSVVGIASKRIMYIDNYAMSTRPWPYFWLDWGTRTTVAKFRHRANGTNDDSSSYTIAGRGKASTIFVDGHVKALFANDVKNLHRNDVDNWQEAD